MAIEQRLRMQLFVTLMVFILTYATVGVVSKKTPKTVDDKEEVDKWYKSLSSDPKHPWYKQKLPAQPHAKFYLYAKACLDDVLDNKKCQKEIFDGLFDKDEVEMRLCGCKIKKMGHMCMKAVAGTTGHMEKYKANADSIYKKADQILDEADKTSC